MDVLLSIKPRFAESIFAGRKKYEYRKNIFKRSDVDRVIVYATQPVKMIVGEFSIDEIVHDDISALWALTCKEAGITEKVFLQYFEYKAKGYAIKIGNPILYDFPSQLQNFNIKAPPQSYMYMNRNQK